MNLSTKWFTWGCLMNSENNEKKILFKLPKIQSPRLTLLC